MTRVKCIDPRLVQRGLAALYILGFLEAAALALYVEAWGRVDIVSVALALANLAAMTAAAAVIMLYVYPTAWALLAVLYPFAGIALYKAASRAWRVGDDCRIVALLSPLFAFLVPLTPLLCAGKLEEWRGTRPRAETAPGASDAAVSPGGG